jgi:hypothetical protein
MTVVTATVLKTNMASAVTAFDTLAATPTDANLTAFNTAADTAIANAKDSRDVTGTSSPLGKLHFDYQQCAEALKKEANSILTHHRGAPAAELTRQLQHAKRTVVSNYQGPWLAYTTAPTTT